MFGLFKPKIYQHKIIFTYISGSTRTKYFGDEIKQAEQIFNEAKEKCLSAPSNILSIAWFRDGKKYRSF